jgi:hypothetical protein
VRYHRSRSGTWHPLARLPGSGRWWSPPPRSGAGRHRRRQVGALLLVAAVLLFLAPSIDAGLRADQPLDGSDFAAAAATAALVATLVRIAAVLARAALAVAAGLVLVVAVAARALPEDWRRGPILGITLTGAVIGLLAGWTALRGGLGVLATPGPIWAGDLTGWPAAPTGGAIWQAPVALALLGVTAAILLPTPWKYDVSGAAAVLATIGTPAAFDLPWWSPVLVGGMVATVFGMAAVAAIDPGPGWPGPPSPASSRLHAAGAGTGPPLDHRAGAGHRGADRRESRPWPGARGTLVEEIETEDATAPGADRWRRQAPPLRASPGTGRTGRRVRPLPQVVMTAALAAASIGLAAVAAVRRQVPQYLTYASAGVAGGATVSALASIPTDLPAGVYAAAAALLGVLAELVRGATVPPVGSAQPVRRWAVLLDGALRRMPDRLTDRRWRFSPAAGALTAAALPTALAVASIAPTLRGAGQAAAGPCRGSGPPRADHTVARSFRPRAGRAARAPAPPLHSGRGRAPLPVVLRAAVTLLIAPIALGRGWPDSTLAALRLPISMLRRALPPPRSPGGRSLPPDRVLVFAIGLAAGGPGWRATSPPSS